MIQWGDESSFEKKENKRSKQSKTEWKSNIWDASAEAAAAAGGVGVGCQLARNVWDANANDWWSSPIRFLVPVHKCSLMTLNKPTNPTETQRSHQQLLATAGKTFQIQSYTWMVFCLDQLLWETCLVLKAAGIFFPLLPALIQFYDKMRLFEVRHVYSESNIHPDDVLFLKSIQV